MWRARLPSCPGSATPIPRPAWMRSACCGAASTEPRPCSGSSTSPPWWVTAARLRRGGPCARGDAAVGETERCSLEGLLGPQVAEGGWDFHFLPPSFPPFHYKYLGWLIFRSQELFIYINIYIDQVFVEEVSVNRGWFQMNVDCVDLHGIFDWFPSQKKIRRRSCVNSSVYLTKSSYKNLYYMCYLRMAD